MNDAGWAQFLTILASKAEKAGLLTVAVKPHGTTQECSCCGQTVKKADATQLEFTSSWNAHQASVIR
ncbi:MAG: zinc ribbon domain-containing protein [Prochloraceae cyanobacterium]|nr:zinc ribbon domain-containing protein [Prochloraceae cyanobacterium]